MQGRGQSPEGYHTDLPGLGFLTRLNAAHVTNLFHHLWIPMRPKNKGCSLNSMAWPGSQNKSELSPTLRALAFLLSTQERDEKTNRTQ